MIRVLKCGERTIIREFYQRIFDDSEEFVEYYFKTYVKQFTRCYIDEEQGNPVSMASVHEKKWNMRDGGQENVWYIYAVATLPEYRGQGRMTRILDAVVQRAALEHVRYLYLIPVNPDIYKPFGFVEVTDSGTFPFRYESAAAMLQEYRLLPAAKLCRQGETIFAILADMHKAYYARCGVDAWLEKTAKYYEEEYQRVRIEDGDIYVLLKGNERKAFIVGTIKDDTAQIVEYIDTDGTLQTGIRHGYWQVILELLHEQTGIRRMEYRQNPVMIYSVDGTPVPRSVGQMDEV